MAVSNSPSNKLTDKLTERVTPQENALRLWPLPHTNAYWVYLGRLMAGEYPGAYRPEVAHERLLAHLETGITTFLDLTHPRDALQPYAQILDQIAREGGVAATYHRLPIRDMDIPKPAEMVTILDTIDELLGQDEVIYLHCWGGIGRTGTVVGCHLVRHGLSGDEALAQIAEWWQGVEKVVRSPRSPETDAQVAMIQDWQRGA